MKRYITITPEIIVTALQSYFTQRGHTNIERVTHSHPAAQLVFETEHAARQSFGEPVPAKCEWPFDCFIQCGDSGVVLSKDGNNYRTAFWEAFPRNPDTFIRGEGATIEEAEQNCFAKYTRILACPEHEFERGTYENGGGFCKHCKMFSSKAFEPTEEWLERQASFSAKLKAKLAAEDSAI